MTIVDQAKACMKKIGGNWDYSTLDFEMKENGDTQLIKIEIDPDDHHFWAWSENYVYFIVYWCPRWGDECERKIVSAPLRPGVTTPAIINDEG